MAARKKKSGSRKSAAKKKAAKTRKSRVAAEESRKGAQAPGGGKEGRSGRQEARGGQEASGRQEAGGGQEGRWRPRTAPPAPTASTQLPRIARAGRRELDNRIAIVRANLRELVEQAASSAGAANEELLSQRIAEQEERLGRLRKEREQIPEEPE